MANLKHELRLDYLQNDFTLLSFFFFSVSIERLKVAKEVFFA